MVGVRRSARSRAGDSGPVSKRAHGITTSFPKARRLLRVSQSIYEDADCNLWVGTKVGGLYKLDPGRTRYVRYRNNPADQSSVASDEITVLFEDREGSVWVGTHGDGIDRFTRKPLPFRRYVHEPGNPNSLDKDSVTVGFSGQQTVSCGSGGSGLWSE